MRRAELLFLQEEMLELSWISKEEGSPEIQSLPERIFLRDEALLQLMVQVEVVEEIWEKGVLEASPNLSMKGLQLGTILMLLKTLLKKF